MIDKKSYNIEFIKCVSYLLVVVLHVIECSSNVLGECIYLLGGFAIPMFFMINGYLLSEKDFTYEYVSKKVWRLMKFILLWGMTIGVITGLAKLSIKQLIVTIIGAFIGKGLLYHLWFLTTLIMIYLICFLIQKVGCARISKYLSKKGFCFIAILFTIIFVIEVILKIEIRNIIPGCFRLITYGGYFYCGMFLKTNGGKEIVKGKYSIIVAILCWMIICFMANRTGLMWASSYYNSPMIFWGSIIMLSYSLKLKFSENTLAIIASLSQCSISIWLFHPLLHRLIMLLLEKCSIVCSLYIRIVEIPIIVYICLIIGNSMRKNKCLIKYIRL